MKETIKKAQGTDHLRKVWCFLIARERLQPNYFTFGLFFEQQVLIPVHNSLLTTNTYDAARALSDTKRSDDGLMMC